MKNNYFCNFFAVAAALLVSAAQFSFASGKCISEGEASFEWIWCTNNDASDFPVARTCFGSLLYTDIIYKAVQLEINADGHIDFECLFTKGAWSETSLPGCPRAIEREFMSAYGEPKITKITECWENDTITWISGKSLNGIPFSSRP